MKPILSLATTAAAATLAAFASPAHAGPIGPGGAGEACWLRAETGRHMTAISAWTAPGVSGVWELSVSRGRGFASEQSGEVGADAARPLTRIVLGQGMLRPPLRDFRAGAAVPVAGGTTVATSNYRRTGPAEAPVRAELRVYDLAGALICETRDVWVWAGR
ncbi:MAG: hypothetical protein ABL308_09450 [Oceanicaulis sp.]